MPALAMTVPVTRRRRRCCRLPRRHRRGRSRCSRLAWSPFVAPPTQRHGQLLLDQPLDEAADLLANARLDRVEPSLPEKQRRVAPHVSCYPSSWRDLRRRANAGPGWLNKPEITPPPNSNHFRDGTGHAMRGGL